MRYDDIPVLIGDKDGRVISTSGIKINIKYKVVFFATKSILCLSSMTLRTIKLYENRVSG